MRNWTLTWDAPGVVLPSTGFAALDVQNGRPVNAFDSATDESIILEGVVPDEHTGSGTLKLRIFGFANASTGVARFEVVTEFRTPNANESAASDNFDGTADVGTITSDSANEMATFTVTLTPATTPAVGDHLRVKVTRDGDGSGGTDSLSVDFWVTSYELYEEV